MQFQVPQFIEVEDKIFGPLTFKQFVYVLGGAGACYLLWRVLPIYAAVPLMIAIGGAIGTGLFLGSSLAVRTAGPAVIISYLIGAAIAEA